MERLNTAISSEQKGEMDKMGLACAALPFLLSPSHSL